MGTQLILTVGKNPLPVWIACDRLVNHWQNQGNIAIQFIYTKGTEAEKNRLEGYCSHAGMTVLNGILTSQSNPDRHAICRGIVDNYESEFTDLHVHYTGGTQAMGVATVCAVLLAKETLRRGRVEVSTDVSYLDPGRNSAPKIVSWAADPLVSDTRKGIGINIQQIADLNGFQAGDFESNDPPHSCPPPQILNEERLLAAQAVLDCYRNIETEFRSNFSNNSSYNQSQWNHIFQPSRNFDHPISAGTFSLPSEIHSDWQDTVLPALNHAYPNCPWNISSGTLSYPARHSATEDQQKDLKEMHTFFNGIWLEYAAYAAFKKVLKEIKRTSKGRRANYALFHNVYVRQQGTGRADRHFELDVVAVLGYQIIVVSCSVTSNRSDIKHKAMEVYHRAKQLGGDEARAVVLCVASYQNAERVEKELEDETGTKRPLQVWGRQRRPPFHIPNMQSLCAKFEKLLFNDIDAAGNPLHLHWT